MLIDKAKIFVKAGSGGNGCNSFYRDKYMRYPIPDGGDGGKGGDIIFRADKNLLTLLDFKYRQHFTALSGGHASSNKKKGKDAKDLIVLLPQGTTVTDSKTKCKLKDLLEDGETLRVARGGEGGKGNTHTKDELELKGKPGEEKELILDLKLIASVGLVGFPNSGKSTLISKLTCAKPKIASYPFTTKEPVLGMVKLKDYSFSIADIPGLIKDSHLGKGLGIQFLRHIERTEILVHLIDMAGVDGRNPIDDYHTINQELKFHSEDIFNKPRVLVANKMDLPQAKDNLKVFKSQIKQKIIPISALDSKGLGELLDAIESKLKAHSS